MERDMFGHTTNETLKAIETFSAHIVKCHDIQKECCYKLHVFLLIIQQLMVQQDRGGLPMVW